MTYHAKLDKFEGPLELLLKLIEEQKLNIAEVSLASVADQYLEYLSQKEQITLENLADFLTVASRLILIKSRTLLPNLEFPEEEEKEILDLEKQLVEFKKFKDISKIIGKMSALNRFSFSREKFLGTLSFFYPPEDVNAFDLKKFFVKVLENIPIMEKLKEEMVREVITLEQKIEHLQNFLRKKIETSFSELVSGAENKVDVIVSFLAMLEMVKQKIINVEQGSLFQEIKIEMKNRAGV